MKFQSAFRTMVGLGASVWLAASGFGAEPRGAEALLTRQGVSPRPVRPSSWAVKLDQPGLPNLHRVTTNLYRGAQPTAHGMAALEAMGIKTVINLRAGNSDVKKLRGTSLQSEHLKTYAWHSDEEAVVQFLREVSDTNNLPVFVHCQRGADRTGLMCALYRVVVCGWSKPEAIREMKEGGFGFNPLWGNLIRFVERADVAELKRQARIAAGQPAP